MDYLSAIAGAPSDDDSNTRLANDGPQEVMILCQYHQMTWDCGGKKRTNLQVLRMHSTFKDTYMQDQEHVSTVSSMIDITWGSLLSSDVSSSEFVQETNCGEPQCPFGISQSPVCRIVNISRRYILETRQR